MTVKERVLEASGMPRHRQLYLVLRDQITTGALVAGQALPSEQALGQQYDVSRITVRRALQDLSDGGFVERRHGVGTFVADEPSPRTGPESLTIMGALRQAQLETTVEIIELEQRPAPVRVACALDLNPAAPVVFVLRVRSHDGEPLMITEAWLPVRFADHIGRDQLQQHALYELLEQAGVTFGRVTQELTAEIADPIRARRLQVDIGSPLLRINRVMHDVSGEPVQYLTINATPQRSRILTDVPANEINTATTGVLAHDIRERPRSGH
jgi:GntR family transcriptional regulator